jgi:hypothetical protein
MDKFLASYIETALWSSTDFDGTPLDDSKYADAELDPKTRARMAADCEKFQAEYAKLVSGLDDSVLRSFPQSDHDGDRIAHDFWLTRNRHGAGFWDGDYPEPIATQLTDLAHSFGESDLYVGDNGKIFN